MEAKPEPSPWAIAQELGSLLFQLLGYFLFFVLAGVDLALMSTVSWKFALAWMSFACFYTAMAKQLNSTTVRPFLVLDIHWSLLMAALWFGADVNVYEVLVKGCKLILVH